MIRLKSLLHESRTYGQRCTKCGRMGGMEAQSADQAMEMFKEKGWRMQVGASLCPKCRRSQTEANEPLGQGQPDFPWHTEDGKSYSAFASDFGGKPPKHPKTGRPIQNGQLKSVKAGEDDNYWQGVVDGVKLTNFND